ncbi:hypothetical protein QJS10_CPB17g00992 [Acorus calamus]|uniref:Ubiquitin-like protease family profile domain-containing protein n=1 Tax=Acorus calamus TaxID=4465 RepID=A0AAV9CWZ1_ACOCL|nr:hypothetical protein QJS10_CPB17g00992 [Acorus calamus]
MPRGRKITYTRLFHELKSEEIHQKIDFIEEERVLLPEVEEDDDNAAPETHNVLMPMTSDYYSVEDLRKGLERVLHMPMPINVVSPSTSPNMKRKREQREQKLVSKKDMDKKVKPVPSKRTPDKVEKKKVGMAEAKYASSSSKRMTYPSPGKRIGSIERMVKIRRSNIPKQCEKSKENQGDVAKKGPKEEENNDFEEGTSHTFSSCWVIKANDRCWGDNGTENKGKTIVSTTTSQKTPGKRLLTKPNMPKTYKQAAKEKHVQLSKDEHVALSCHRSKMESEELQPVYREVTNVLRQNYPGKQRYIPKEIALIDKFLKNPLMDDSPAWEVPDDGSTVHTMATRKHLFEVISNQWLGEEQYIDGGLERCERFFQAYKWKAEEDVLTQAKVVLVPMFTLHHWFLLVIDLMNSQFLLYDSLRKKEHTAWAGKAVKILQKTVLQETVE